MFLKPLSIVSLYFKSVEIGLYIYISVSVEWCTGNPLSSSFTSYSSTSIAHAHNNSILTFTLQSYISLPPSSGESCLALLDDDVDSSLALCRARHRRVYGKPEAAEAGYTNNANKEESEREDSILEGSKADSDGSESENNDSSGSSSDSTDSGSDSDSTFNFTSDDEGDSLTSYSSSNSDSEEEAYLRAKGIKHRHAHKHHLHKDEAAGKDKGNVRAKRETMRFMWCSECNATGHEYVNM